MLIIKFIKIEVMAFWKTHFIFFQGYVQIKINYLKLNDLV